MEFVGRAELSVIFILAGGVLLAASYRIAHLARRYRGRMENLLQLASKPLDPLEIPGAAWADLEAGGWLRLEWDGVWFGQPVSGCLQAVAPAKRRATGPLCFELASGDEVRLVVRLIHGEAWGENRLFAEHLARVFVLLLETACMLAPRPCRPPWPSAPDCRSTSSMTCAIRRNGCSGLRTILRLQG
jgi:hypothetical protein